MYQLEVKRKDPSLSPSILFRRYREFDEMHSKLLQCFPSEQLPPLPGKIFIPGKSHTRQVLWVVECWGYTQWVVEGWGYTQWVVECWGYTQWLVEGWRYMQWLVEGWGYTQWLVEGWGYTQWLVECWGYT